MNRPAFLRIALLALALGSLAGARATTLTVEIGSGRDRRTIDAAVESRVVLFARNAAALTHAARRAQRRSLRREPPPFGLPVTVLLTDRGRIVGGDRSSRQGETITLAFASVGPLAFPPAYRGLLQEVFEAARPTLDALFGPPARGGSVLVTNFDARIGDRDAVVGGIYLPDNGSGRPEIRFPVYADAFGFKAETAAVNFLHCVLLAYWGADPIPFDAYQEGFVRAVTARAARTPGALPRSLDRSAVEAVLEATYDCSPYYDWWNQRALGAPRFIAPNLRDLPLPPGGSVGGPYLARYLMAGTAWQKVLVEYPSFIAEFRRTYHRSPAAFRSETQLLALAESTLTGLAGPNATVEGQRFSEWHARQAILQARLVPGVRVMNQPFPVLDGLSGSDFGVFVIQTHWFETDARGDETLLAGRGFPIFWDPRFGRFSTSAQDDRMDLAGGYGAIAPNFPRDLAAGQPYRVVVDIPIGDRTARSVLPAGAVATAAQPTPNTFFGTLLGFPAGTYAVNVSWPGGSRTGLPVTEFAFGAAIQDADFLRAQRLTVTVVRVDAGNQVVLRRQVNKGPGPLGLDLRSAEGFQASGSLSSGLSAFGLLAEPFAAYAPDVLGTTPERTLLARWNPARNRFDFFPNTGSLDPGLGFFGRFDAPRPIGFFGRSTARVPVTVALRPGWNLVANPRSTPVDLARLAVVVGSAPPRPYAELVGQALGTEAFEFAPGPPDPASGLPETGTLRPVSRLQPGQAVYVRVFAPEGAALVFGTELEGSGSRSGGAPPRHWRANLRVVGAGSSALAQFGRASGATRGFDPAWDAELPPSAGGLQIAFAGGLFRDVRGFGGQELFVARVTGLVPGARYRVRVEPAAGHPLRFGIRDDRARVDLWAYGQAEYSFAASASEHVLVVTSREQP